MKKSYMIAAQAAFLSMLALQYTPALALENIENSATPLYTVAAFDDNSTYSAGYNEEPSISDDQLLPEEVYYEDVPVHEEQGEYIEGDIIEEETVEGEYLEGDIIEEETVEVEYVEEEYVEEYVESECQEGEDCGDGEYEQQELYEGESYPAGENGILEQ